MLQGNREGTAEEKNRGKTFLSPSPSPFPSAFPRSNFLPQSTDKRK